MADEVKVPLGERGSAAGDLVNLGWSSWSSGGDDIEKVLELQWPRSVSSYHAMMNDAQIMSLMHSLVLPIRSYRWYLEPNNASPESVQRISQDYNLPVGLEGEFFRRRGARRFSFDKHLEDALRALVYGHYFFEQVGEIGEGIDGLPNDGKWHLRKLGIRAPRTITEINVDKDGGLKSIRQGYDTRKPAITVDRLVAYVWDREGANWTGRSMLRSVYRNHIVKDRVLRVGAINIERAGGIPYVEAPEGASGQQIRELDALARRFRVGEAAGAALPHGAQLKFAAAAGGDGAVQYIKLQNEEMARMFLQMVNMLGQTNSGSRALGLTFNDIAAVAQYTIAKWFADTFNEHVIEDDVEFNEGPTQEFAPLLKFEMGGAEPLSGFSAAAGQDDGIQVDPQGDVAAMLELPSVRLPSQRVHRAIQAAGRRSTERGNTVAGGLGEQASPVPLPARPLRRQPYAHEIQAAVDFSAMDSSYDSALTLLEQEVGTLRRYQIDDLREQIINAKGDLEKLSSLQVSGEAKNIIKSRLEQVASIAAGHAIEEARTQGVTVPRPDVSDLEGSTSSRAAAVDKILSTDLAGSASRQAIRLTGGSLSPVEVGDAVHEFLTGLSYASARDLLGGAIQQSINAGRKLVYQRDDKPGTIYASELLDTNTCTDCVRVDGTQYENVTSAERDYPTGGFKNCQGRERCRGTLIKVYATGPVADRPDAPAFTVTQ